MIAIHAEQLTKRYPLDSHPTAKLRYALHPKPSYPSFTAVDDVSFTLDAGDTLGVLGVNGAGKSTLLKMLAGVTTPTSGSLRVNGRVGALLELGAGFNLEYTGIENAKLSLMLAGIPKKQVGDYLDDILSFADIGDFVRMPVKTYSSGMFVRLAFAAATATRPDILLVDEALSVGDLFFQAKCVRRMKDMLSGGTALVFVSHDIGAVKSVCRQCLLLNGGKMDMMGTTEKVARRYFTLKVAAEQPTAVVQSNEEDRGNIRIFKSPAIRDELQKAACETSDDLSPQIKTADLGLPDEVWSRRTAQNRFGDGRARFESVQLLDENGRPLDNPTFGQTALLRMQIVSNSDLDELCVGYHIQSSSGVDVIYSDTAIENSNLTNLKSKQRYIVEWKFSLALGEGAHNIAVVCSVPVDIASSQVEFCDYVHCAAQFDMQRRQQAKIYSLSYWPNEVHIHALSTSDHQEVHKH